MDASPAPPAPRGLVGFTLIEMMVVMVLLGLLTTLALPAMQRWHDGVRARTQIMGVVEALRAASFAAGVNRRQLLVDKESFSVALKPVPASQGASAASSPTTAEAAAATPPHVFAEPVAAAPAPVADRAKVTLPNGWSVDRIEPAAFLANGLCSPGVVAFKTEAGAQVAVEILGPTCSVGIIDPSVALRR